MDVVMTSMNWKVNSKMSPVDCDENIVQSYDVI